jgi:hypothetical protein
LWPLRINAIIAFASQRLSHLLVIDFESTCWGDQKAANPPPEIIEFPVVRLSIAIRPLEFHTLYPLSTIH